MVPTPVVPAPAEAPETASVHEPPGRPWELELLLSGAVLFALVQMPGPAERWFTRLTPHLQGGQITVAVSLHLAVQMLLYALIAAFTIHLVGRAYWVGIVGLDAVFPRGVRWSESRYGPISLRYAQERFPSLQTLTDRADRFCSMIFSFTFTVTLMAVMGALLAAVLLLAAFGLSQLFWEGRHGMAIAAVLYVVLLGPMMLVNPLDRRYGARLDPDSRAARMIRLGVRLQNVLFLSALVMPIMNVLTTNINRKVVYAVLFTTLFAVEGAVFARLMAMDGDLRIGDYAALPAEESAGSLEAHHYANQRVGDEFRLTEPMIQSDVIREPFLKLFVPFQPRRQGAVLAERCPSAAAAERPEGMATAEWERREAARLEAVVRCLAEVQPVTLNGAPISHLRFRAYTDPRTGVRGMLAYLPTRDLAAGENLLVVAGAPRPSRGPGADREVLPHYIPFWIAR